MLSRLLMVTLAMLSVMAWADDESGGSMSVVVRTCVTCHHPDNQAIPPLPGSLDRVQLIARLRDMRDADRVGTENTVMHRLLGGFDNHALEVLAKTLTESP
ncbi:MAG: hypothetical protein HUJ31_18400 [Pseudomonadales bacterium]|nr:hypothetical protein [Pseudomonadales bacterium]